MRYITVVRARIKAATPQAAQAAHDATVAHLRALTGAQGAVGHQPYLNPQDPTQFQAVDTWASLEGIQQFMNNPAVAEAFGQLFDGRPEVTVWAEAEGWAAFMA